MTAAVQPPPAIPTPLDAAPLAVRAFVAAHELAEHFEAAVRLARETFPAGSALALRLEEDPDAEGRWVVMDWTVPATERDALADYTRFVSEWNALTPPWVGKYLRVTFFVA